MDKHDEDNDLDQLTIEVILELYLENKGLKAYENLVKLFEVDKDAVYEELELFAESDQAEIIKETTIALLSEFIQDGE